MAFNSLTGKNAGSKSKRGEGIKTEQWKVLGEAITGKHTERFNNILDNSIDEVFVNNYLQILKYFKPSKIYTEVINENPPPIIFQNVSKQFPENE